MSQKDCQYQRKARYEKTPHCNAYSGRRKDTAARDQHERQEDGSISISQNNNLRTFWATDHHDDNKNDLENSQIMDSQFARKSAQTTNDQQK